MSYLSIFFRSFLGFLALTFSFESTAITYDARWKAGNACAYKHAELQGGRPACPSSYHFASEKVYRLTYTNPLIEYYYTDGGCPKGKPDEKGICPEPVKCPDSGTKFTGNISVKSSNPSVLAVIGGVRSIDGCQLNSTKRIINCITGLPAEESAVSCYISTGYEYTGSPVPDSTDIKPLENDSDNPQAEIPEGVTYLSDGDHLKDDASEIFGDFVTTDLADGVKVTSKTDVKTEIKGAGVKIRTKQDSVTALRTDGISKTITTTTITTTKSDGSKTVEQTVNTKYKQSDNTIIAVRNSDGRVTRVNSKGFLGEQSVTTKDDFDSSGNRTGSTTNTSHSGTPESESDKPVDECEQNPKSVNCIEFTPPTGKGSFDQSAIKSDIEQAKSSVKSELLKVKSDVQEMFKITVNSSDEPACIDLLDWNGEQRPICISDFSGELEPMRAMLLFLGFIAALFIIFR